MRATRMYLFERKLRDACQERKLHGDTFLIEIPSGEELRHFLNLENESGSLY